jgi:hypothetical protein
MVSLCCFREAHVPVDVVCIYHPRKSQKTTELAVLWSIRKLTVRLMGYGLTCVALLWEARAMSEQNALVSAGGAQATSSE